MRATSESFAWRRKDVQREMPARRSQAVPVVAAVVVSGGCHAAPFRCARSARSSCSASTSPDRARRRLTAARLGRFVQDVGGVQMDSINVLDRAHYLTLWSRFGPYDRARGSTGSSTAAGCCSSTGRTPPAWCPPRRCRGGGAPCSTIACATPAGRTGCGEIGKTLALVTAAISANGPMANADFEGRRPQRAGRVVELAARAARDCTTCG